MHVANGVIDDICEKGGESLYYKHYIDPKQHPYTVI